MASPHQDGPASDRRSRISGGEAMKILFATSEFANYAKAGGLGDVSAGLPRALRRRGIDARAAAAGVF